MNDSYIIGYAKYSGVNQIDTGVKLPTTYNSITSPRRNSDPREGQLS